MARERGRRLPNLMTGAFLLSVAAVIWPADIQASQAETVSSVTSAVSAAPPTGTTIATLRIPRFGPEYAEPIGEGVNEAAVLNTMIGHFPGTAMPGESGNFALAGHRVTHGKPFNLIGNLVIGDPLIVETVEGHYLYRFRASEYVEPSAIDVTYPMPRQPMSGSTEKIITFVACNPLFSTKERIIAYGVFEAFIPAASATPG